MPSAATAVRTAAARSCPIDLEPLESRRLLAVVGTANGFGAKATGGAGGATVTVATAADFAKYATAAARYTIQVSGTIDIGNVRVASNKSIVGLGTTATVKGSLGLYGVSNVIVQNLIITNPNDAGEGDGITIKNSTRDVWIDHCTFFNTPDGLLDITNGSDFITASWNKFYCSANDGHNFAVLIGSSDSATGDVGKLHVTLHHNWWSTSVVERMPSVRYGRVHLYNNYFNTPGNNYAVRSRIGAEVLIQNNSFENVKDPYYIYVTNGQGGKIRASGNVFTNVMGKIDDGNDTVFAPPYAYTLDSATNVKAKVTTGAGAGKLAATAGPQPAHWWKLDSTSGTTATDAVGGVNGRLVNTESTDWVAGKVNRGLSLDGANEHVDLGATLNHTRNFTIAAWIKPARVTGVQGIFGKVSDANNKQYLLTLAGNRLNFQYERNGNNWSVQGGTLQAGVWQHVAVTVTSALRVTLYVNGAAVASATAPAETLASTRSVNIGRWGGTYASGYFAGLVDEVKFFASALTAAQVDALS